MKKLNDEQLSRVLSAHEDGMLKIADELDPGGYGCLRQQATATQCCGAGPDTDWFDYAYETLADLPTEDFLRELERVGLA